MCNRLKKMHKSEMFSVLSFTKIFLVFIFVFKLTAGIEVKALELVSPQNKSNAVDSIPTTTDPPYIRADTPNCSQGSPLDELPGDLFTKEQRQQGAILLHLLGAIYFFTHLAVICNDYFLPAVECICIDLNIPKDVAAATFMATATTMPELFTNTISTFITESDMGLGTIIGSLMFNTLGVAAISGLAVSKSVQLDWWPVTRDCLFYSFNTVVLIGFCWGGKVTFVETLIMVILCCIYYATMFLNNPIMTRFRVLIEDQFNCCLSTRYDLTVPPEKSAKAKLPLEKDESNQQDGVFTVSQNEFSSKLNLTPKEKEEEEEAKRKSKSLFRVPDGSIIKKIWWFYSWPIKAFLTCFCPNPKTNRKYYPITFLMCIALIGINSYLIVWMLTVFGETFSVPDTVMGITFLAAGATMPEALSSVITVRKGEGGIGVSNALGANSLAILLSLGVPWFIKNSMNYYKEDGTNVIHINSQGIEYTIAILLISTAALFIILAFSGFRLRRSVGLVLLSVYSVLITLQILIEMNVFFPSTSTC